MTTSGGGSGYLSLGGSYVSLVTDPDVDGSQQLTIIVEKLEGACLRCSGQTTQPETVVFELVGALANYTTLSFWSTNETDQFIQLANLTVVDGIVSFVAQPDTVYTLSSLTGQQHGGFDLPIPQPGDFPFPYAGLCR